MESTSSAGGSIFAVLLFAVLAIGGIVLYFLPFVIAMIRRHHNATAIFVLNLFLGWTFLGWIGALVWACTAVERIRYR